MLKTRNKNYFQVLIDDSNRNALREYGAGQSYNEVISRILQHHESAISIISSCSHCRETFKKAIGEGQTLTLENIEASGPAKDQKAALEPVPQPNQSRDSNERKL